MTNWLGTTTSVPLRAGSSIGGHAAGPLLTGPVSLLDRRTAAKPPRASQPSRVPRAGMFSVWGWVVASPVTGHFLPATQARDTCTGQHGKGRVVPIRAVTEPGGFGDGTPRIVLCKGGGRGLFPSMATAQTTPCGPNGLSALQEAEIAECGTLCRSMCGARWLAHDCRNPLISA